MKTLSSSAIYRLHLLPYIHGPVMQSYIAVSNYYFETIYIGPQLTIIGTTYGCLTFSPLVSLTYRAKCIDPGVSNQWPTCTRTRPDTRYFFRYPTWPDSILKTIEQRVTRNIGYCLIFRVNPEFRVLPDISGKPEVSGINQNFGYS